jgi:hypothetical protein
MNTAIVDAFLVKRSEAARYLNPICYEFVFKDYKDRTYLMQAILPNSAPNEGNYQLRAFQSIREHPGSNGISLFCKAPFASYFSIADSSSVLQVYSDGDSTVLFFHNVPMRSSPASETMLFSGRLRWKPEPLKPVYNGKASFNGTDSTSHVFYEEKNGLHEFIFFNRKNVSPSELKLTFLEMPSHSFNYSISTGYTPKNENEVAILMYDALNNTFIPDTTQEKLWTEKLEQGTIRFHLPKIPAYRFSIESFFKDTTFAEAYVEPLQ